jgi:hypothetical protein
MIYNSNKISLKSEKKNEHINLVTWLLLPVLTQSDLSDAEPEPVLIRPIATSECYIIYKNGLELKSVYQHDGFIERVRISLCGPENEK